MREDRKSIGRRHRSITTWMTAALTYAAIGLATIIASAAIGEGRADYSYFDPFIRIVQGVSGTSDDPLAAMVMTVRFSALFLLAVAFISAFRGGYILLGFEGATILALVLMVIVTHILSGGGPINILYWFASAIVAGIVILVIFTPLMGAFYKVHLDDVTPGIVLNVLAVPVAALLLGAFGLLDNDDQGVASVAATGAAANAGGTSQYSLSILLVLACVAAAAIAAFVFSQTRAGLLVRAVGSNRRAAEITGISLARTAATLSFVLALCVVAVASAHYFSTGRIQMEMVRNQLIDVLTAALVARLSFSGLPFGVLALLGLAEFKLYLQYNEFAPETVLAGQGIVLLIFAFYTPLRGRDNND